MAAEYFTFYQVSDTSTRVRTNETKLYNGDQADVEGGFTVATFERSGFEIGPRALKNDLDISFPITNEFAVNRFVRRFEDRYWLEIRTTHDGTPFWVGRLETVKASLTGFKMNFTSRIGAVSLSGPPQDFQYDCRHALFDSGCRQPRIDSGARQNNWMVNITTVSNFDNQIEIGATPVIPNNYLPSLRYGYLVQSGRNYRVISTIGRTVLNLDSTQDLVTGAARLWAGCDKKMGTCEFVFGNLTNFGGFPYKPQTGLWGESLIAQSNQLNRYNR